MIGLRFLPLDAADVCGAGMRDEPYECQRFIASLHHEIDSLHSWCGYTSHFTDWQMAEMTVSI